MESEPSEQEPWRRCESPEVPEEIEVSSKSLSEGDRYRPRPPLRASTVSHDHQGVVPPLPPPRQPHQTSLAESSSECHSPSGYSAETGYYMDALLEGVLSQPPELSHTATIHDLVSKHVHVLEATQDHRFELCVAQLVASTYVHRLVATKARSRSSRSAIKGRDMQERDLEQHVEDKLTSILAGVDLKGIVSTELRQRSGEIEQRVLQEAQNLISDRLSPVSRPSTVPGPPRLGQSISQNSDLTAAAYPTSQTPRAPSPASAASAGCAVQPFSDEGTVRSVLELVMAEIGNVVQTHVHQQLAVEGMQDVIRTLVREAVAENVPNLLKMGREQIVKQEVGQAVRELERLRIEMNGVEARWEERFIITSELRALLDNLQQATTEQHENVQQRMADLERGYVAQGQLNEVMQGVDKHFEMLRHRAAMEDDRSFDFSSRLVATGKRVQEALNIRHELGLVNDLLRDDLDHIRLQLQEGLIEVRTYAAAKTETDEWCRNHRERLDELQSSLESAHSGSHELRDVVQHMKQHVEDTFAKKQDVHLDAVQREEAAAQRASQLEVLLAELDQRKASVEELHSSRSEMLCSVEEMTSRGETMAAELKSLHSEAQAFKDFCAESYCTHAGIRAVVQEFADQAYHDIDMRVEVAKLKDDLALERARGLQLSQQQSQGKLQLTCVEEAVGDLKTAASHLHASGKELEEKLESFEKKEEKRWSEGQTAMEGLKTAYHELDQLLGTTSEGLTNILEMQREENDRMRQHTTQRLFEQMDKALTLHRSVEKVEVGHQELKETLHGLKLPKV